jgi:uncharacterized protein
MTTLQKLNNNGITISDKEIEFICEKYQIIELSVFGSSIRSDFKTSSDVDFLVSFKDKARITIFDLIDLQNEFSTLLNREVDIVEKESLKNPIRRKNIIENREILYADK